ncbi:MAG TPA: FAD-binding protein, partial [Azonexus sp.]|nr:FAD-binding protein [Azonexus sp.]
MAARKVTSTTPPAFFPLSEAMHASSLPPAVRQSLAGHFGPRFSCGDSTRLQHGRDESIHEPALPDGVIMVESTEEVALVVELCARHGVPVIPYGVGSSVEGHVLAPGGGIS